ncbi:hypothetical protein ACFLV4_05865 [Chloroflexota bacterium]
MSILANKLVMGIIGIVVGVIILIWPAIIAWVIGILLIVCGILTLLGKTPCCSGK